MKKIELPIVTKFENRMVSVEYDDTEYHIHFIDDEYVNGVALIRLANNHLLKVFPVVGLESITQKNVNGEKNFIVSYDKEESLKHGEVYLNSRFQHYRDSICNKELKFQNVWTFYYSGELIYGTDHTYMIGDDISGFSLYNLKEKLFGLYEKSYENLNNPKIKELRKKNILLVGRKVLSKYNLQDFLVYGIDMDTLKIATPIWSQLQQRCIPVYNEDQEAVLTAADSEELTIRYGVEKYLGLLDRMIHRMCLLDRIDNDSIFVEKNIDDEVNIEEVVKKLVR